MLHVKVQIDRVPPARTKMLSKTAEYALRAIVCLATPPVHPKSADVLAQKTKVPRSYLHRVLQDLTGADLVRSRPGPGGGYELARPSDGVTILDVINAVDPIERIRHCPLGLTSHTELCPLHHELDQAYAAIETAFRSVSLKKLLGSTSQIVPLCEVNTRR
jgi:Rrf2 family transcriptional regulator, nitric oxide-sensitive transcriptional repressor